MMQRAALGAFGVFLALASAIALVASITLLGPHSVLAGIWAGKQAAFRQPLVARLAADAGFAAVSATLAVAAVQWHRRRRLGRLPSAVVLAVNLAADVAAPVATRQGADLAAACLDGLALAWPAAPATRDRLRP